MRCKLAQCQLNNDYVVCDSFDANRYDNLYWGQVMVITWSKGHRHFMFCQRLLKFGKYHFCIISKRTLCYRTGNVWAKCSKSRKWEKGSVERRNACVCWFFQQKPKIHSLTLPPKLHHPPGFSSQSARYYVYIYSYLFWTFKTVTSIGIFDFSSSKQTETEGEGHYYKNQNIENQPKTRRTLKNL